MINLSANRQLGIVLPSSNKALAEVLKNISPQELEVISEAKDLKSIINSLLKDTLKNSKSDKLLLELLKNNPTLKKLGNISNTIKDLLTTLKSDKNPLPIEKVLKDFLVDIKNLSEPILKKQITNSGVFLESKLKNVKNPQIELKTLLESLSKSIEKSELPIAKELNRSIKIVLSSKVIQEASHSEIMQPLKNEPKSVQKLSQDIKNVVTKLQEFLKSGEPITPKIFTTQITKLENILKVENLHIPKLQMLLQDLTSLLSQSTKLDTKVIDRATETFTNIENSIPASKVSPEIRTLIDSLKVSIERADPLFSKEVFSKLSSFSNPAKLIPNAQIKEIITTDLKSVLLQASDEIVKSSHPNQTEILKHIDKLALQIDYHQMISHLSNATSLYIPFSWDQMQEGNINLKTSDDNKFYCDIDLTLKEYGELRVRLALYDDNQINIHLYSSNDDFREIIRENISELRSLLIDKEINPREIHIFDTDKINIPKPYKNYSSDIDMGFDMKA